MNKQQIEITPVWQYISKLSGPERYFALTGKNASMFEDKFNVKLEEWPFTSLSKIPNDWAYISVTDSFRHISFIMVAKPKAL